MVPMVINFLTVGVDPDVPELQHEKLGILGITTAVWAQPFNCADLKKGIRNKRSQNSIEIPKETEATKEHRIMKDLDETKEKT